MTGLARHRSHGERVSPQPVPVPPLVPLPLAVPEPISVVRSPAIPACIRALTARPGARCAGTCAVPAWTGAHYRVTGLHPQKLHSRRQLEPLLAYVLFLKQYLMYETVVSQQDVGQYRNASTTYCVVLGLRRFGQIAFATARNSAALSSSVSSYFDSTAASANTILSISACVIYCSHG